ncbi:MAG: DUF3467 domain-containing protein [Elusimicrobiota bacterium]
MPVKKRAIQVFVDPKVSKPKFVNHTAVEIEDDGFVVDYMHIHNTAICNQMTHMVARLRLDATQTKRLFYELKSAISKYEKEHGKIREPRPAPLRKLQPTGK